MSVFDKYRAQAYPYLYRATIHVGRIAGGIPTDPRVVEGWLKAKLGIDRAETLREMVAEVMVERGADAETAVTEVANVKTLNGFKRDKQTGQLYIEGRQVKAGIKEAANTRWPKERWGPTRKGTLSFFAEHVFVQEDRLPLFTVDENDTLVTVTEPSDVAQRFVHTWRGSAIQYEEIVHEARICFTVATDVEFAREQWGMLWLTAGSLGLGASRSQGYGTYEMVGWDRIQPEERAQ